MVSAAAWAELLAHTAAEWPREACGLLVGRIDADGNVRIAASEAGR